MTDTTNTTLSVAVKILDKEYQVSCPIAEKKNLIEAAHYLDQQMQLIRSNGKIIGIDRIAVIAALNISYEFLQSRQSINREKNITHQQIEQLLSKLNNALDIKES